MNPISTTFAVVGGGIAGVTLVEQLSSECPDKSILLISASPLIKATSNVKQLTRALQEFEVCETNKSVLEAKCPNVNVLHGNVTKLDAVKHTLYLQDKQIIVYEKLCLCTGARPKIIAEDNQYVLGIRDTETAQVFQKKLCDARRVVVVGNGGIATELVYEIQNCQVIWAVRQDSIGATFFDAGAAQFFLPFLSADKVDTACPVKRTKYTITGHKTSETTGEVLGGALGPDWAVDVNMKGKGEKSHDVLVEYKCEVSHIYSPSDIQQKKLQVEPSSLNDSWPVYVQLTNSKIYGCDFIISATGVVPNVEPFLDENSFELAEDRGFKVDDQMRTNVQDVYASGDICTTNWETGQHWFQMRLWTQARLMGFHAARAMAENYHGEMALCDISFDLFAHVTRFFNYKVVLLGLFNGQKLDNKYEIYLRVTKGEEFVKVILKDGRMQGAILIGETDLEETFENLILNQMDLSMYGEDLLNPAIDIEDYFD